MTRPSCRRLAFFAILFACWSAGSRAQDAECSALKDRLDALQAGRAGRYAAALDQQRDEIARTRADAARVGCGDGEAFDGSDAMPCGGFARRLQTLNDGLSRLSDRAARGDAAAEARRRALEADIASTCAAEAEPPVEAPADPDAPAVPTERRYPRVLCVRRCDGAFYPLAVDVASGRMGDMDRICQAQCPAAAAAAYAGEASGDVSGAVASDGSTYGALPDAFRYLRGSTRACACRSPRQSWAEALAGADALLEPHEGDVVVTAALQGPRVPAKGRAGPTVRPAAPATSVARPGAPPSGRDLTREIRRASPKP